MLALQWPEETRLILLPCLRLAPQEKLRRINSMSPLDKVTYHVVRWVRAAGCINYSPVSPAPDPPRPGSQGKAVLGHRYSRLAFVIYALILHFLVFMVRSVLLC